MRQSWQNPGGEYTVSYTYLAANGLLGEMGIYLPGNLYSATSTSNTPDVKLSFTYDALNRLSRRTTVVNGTEQFYSGAWYAETAGGDGTQRTNQVKHYRTIYRTLLGVIMQIVFDFLSGKMPFDEFYKTYNEDPSIAAWLDGLTDFNAPCPPAVEKKFWARHAYLDMQKNGGKVSDYIAKRVFTGDEKGFHLACKQEAWHGSIAAPVLAAYPDTKITRLYARNASFYLDAMGNSIGGSEVEDYAEQILEKFPPTMKVGERTKAGKKALWKAFHIKGRKFPRWPQSADWPMGKNSPMEYLGQRQDGELVELRFRDVDTGEIRIVKDYY